MRINITLECKDCGEQNYRVSKNRRNQPDKMSINKYCPRCNTRTVHIEKK
ncbi:MAG: 50S ribosomal protein L33 [Erysipelotrichaceae bacterium]|nr:50S ribosomal protein L33 [Erysipelotrichaceae bacterium]